jgi:hypothetical protein
VVIENALCLHASLPALNAHRYLSTALPLSEKEHSMTGDRFVNQPTLAAEKKAEFTARALEDAANPHKPGARTE